LLSNIISVSFLFWSLTVFFDGVFGGRRSTEQHVPRCDERMCPFTSLSKSEVRGIDHRTINSPGSC